MSVRHSPPPLTHFLHRRCVVCRESAPKAELARVVRPPAGEIVLSSSIDGRGAYVHHHPDCLSEAATEPRRLARALRRPPPDAILSQLKQMATQIAH